MAFELENSAVIEESSVLRFQSEAPKSCDFSAIGLVSQTNTFLGEVLLRLEGSDDGEWETCAVDGGTCSCSGYVRMGSKSIGYWGPPAAVNTSATCR